VTSQAGIERASRRAAPTGMAVSVLPIHRRAGADGAANTGKVQARTIAALLQAIAETAAQPVGDFGASNVRLIARA